MQSVVDTIHNTMSTCMKKLQDINLIDIAVRIKSFEAINKILLRPTLVVTGIKEREVVG